jgi:hypothetical protein
VLCHSKITQISLLLIVERFVIVCELIGEAESIGDGDFSFLINQNVPWTYITRFLVSFLEDRTAVDQMVEQKPKFRLFEAQFHTLSTDYFLI